MKHLFSLVLILLLASFLLAQSPPVDPNPQPLPYWQDFSSLPWNSTAYPEGFTGWWIYEEPTTEYSTSPATYHRNLTASGNASIPGATIYNYNGKIGLLDALNQSYAIAFALDTSGKQNIQLSYDIMTIRNPYEEPLLTQINEATLQYRIGTEGPFISLTGIEYQNGTVNKTNTNANPQNLQPRSTNLPAECSNQPILQLRLVSRLFSGTGERRPSFAIDNISVTGEDIPTLPVELSCFIATISANNHISLTWVTQTETAMQGYYVLRASDDQLSTARIVSPMIAATNHSQQQSYVFLDTEVYDSGTYYYWLQANDLDGTTNFHGPVSLIYNPLVDNPAPEIPRFTELRAVFPNPFNPRACIDFYLETPAPVVFRVFDAHGRLVRELEPGFCPAGQQRVEWDSRDAAGTLCGSGIYHIRMDVGARSFTGKAVLLK